MLIWICALHCEAKPVIDFYRLKKSHRDHAFDLYRNDDMVCVVSGPGKLASATATAWIAAQHSPATTASWINLGTAGAAELEIGSPMLLHQVVDADTGQRFYPVIPEKPSLDRHAGMCLSQASTEYREQFVFDMESSGFLHAALRFSSAELIRCIKVISDNRYAQSGRDRQRVSALIQRNIEAIDGEAQALRMLGGQLEALEIAAQDWQSVTALASFSETQRNQLRVLLRYLLNRRHRADDLIKRLRPLDSAAGMLRSLEQLCHQDSERL